MSFRFLRSLLSLGLITGVAGCAATSAPTSTPPLPWWVAQPSAPLPKGFPPPGPLDQIVIKQYPPYRAAIVTSASDASTTNGMFFPLFNHIEKNQVSMSSPVEIGYAPPATTAAARPQSPAPAQSMAFIYGDTTVGKPGPDGNVQVRDFPALTVVSLGVAGSYSDEHFAIAYARLADWLAAHPDQYTRAGHPRYLAYNSPFVLPFSRYGEVQIPIRPVGQ